ncbi:MAG: hypothetical protein EOP47_27720, partial [Sphingobacteriaceae bacterium]
MKKSLSLYIGLLLLISVNAVAQKSVFFKIKYKPKHSYILDVKTHMDMQMDFKGDSIALDSMKMKGMSNSMNMQMLSTMQMNIITTGPGNNGTYPFTMKVNPVSIKGTINGNDIPIPTNSSAQKTFSGICSAEGKLAIDSISGSNIDENTKKTVIAAVNALQ